jgi:hypothetical protein
MADADYEHSVFVNCPFDDAYRPLFDATVFAIHACGYTARCAVEADDGSQVRIDKIATIITECRFGIHDISRTEPDLSTGLPRFNMPFELGMFMGAKRYGRAAQRQKICLILDVERHRYQKFISDIAGQDIAAHGGEVARAITIVRDWLSNAAPKTIHFAGGAALMRRYESFRDQLPAACERLHLRVEELTFNNYVVQAEEWLRAERAGASS